MFQRYIIKKHLVEQKMNQLVGKFKEMRK